MFLKQATPIFLILIFLTTVFSCSMDSPDIKVVNGKSYCSISAFDLYNAANDSNLQRYCGYESKGQLDFINENKESIQITLNQIINNVAKTEINDNTDYFKGPFGFFMGDYVIIQNNTQLKEIEKNKLEANNDPCNCTQYNLTGELNGWTYFSTSYKSSCSFSTSCYQPPAYCLFLGKNTTDPLAIIISAGIIILLAAIIIGGGIILFKKLKVNNQK